jgi:hypothetical protein
MGIVSETYLSGKRWYVARDDPMTIVGIVAFALITCVFTLPILRFFLRPSVTLFGFGAIGCGLWVFLVRGVRLLRFQYELVIGRDFIRWGWSHKRDQQDRVPTLDVVEVNYRHGHGDSDDDLELVTKGGAIYQIDPSLSGRQDLVRGVIDYLLTHYPRIAVREFE